MRPNKVKPGQSWPLSHTSVPASSSHRSVTQDSHTAIEKLSFNTYPEVYGDNSQELVLENLIKF